MNLPKNIRIDVLRDAVAESRAESRQVIARNRLEKVAGGLYRIRDDYASIWSLEADKDGKQYIIRADDQSSDRVYLAEDISRDGLVATANAYIIEKQGAAHVVWECNKCRVANMTAYGNRYECDVCHDKPGDVLADPDATKKSSYTRQEVSKMSMEVADRMVREGVSEIHESLLNTWLVEAKGGPWDKPWNKQKKDKPKGGYSKVKRQLSEEESPYDKEAKGTISTKPLRVRAPKSPKSHNV